LVVAGGYLPPDIASTRVLLTEPARVRQAYAGNFERLQALKDRYDPANVFHLNQNIPPSH